MYGIQTDLRRGISPTLFENDVKMYGIQTSATLNPPSIAFENDVKMYGIQTQAIVEHRKMCLRMM